MSQISNFPYCTAEDVANVFPEIEDYHPRDTLTGFTVVSGNAQTFSKHNTGYYGVIFENGIALTATTTIALVQATASRFWYDSTNDILYLHCSDGLDPDTHTITAANKTYKAWVDYLIDIASEDLESVGNIKYNTPFTMARYSHTLHKYDHGIWYSVARVAVSHGVRYSNIELADRFKNEITNAEQTGYFDDYIMGRRAFSFESTVDDFNGRLENITLDDASTGLLYLAGKGKAGDHFLCRVKIDTAGAVETATFKVSDDDGRTWITTLNKTYNQFVHLAAGIRIRFDGTFVLDDEWEIEIAGGPDEAIGASIKNIRMIR